MTTTSSSYSKANNNKDKDKNNKSKHRDINNNNDNNNKNNNNDDSIIITTTPLPYNKIALLGIILAVNNSSIWMIFSFLPFMITNFFPELNNTEIGYKAGILGSSFSAGSLIGNFLSSIISDHYGRRPALLLGLLGTALTSLLFGFSSYFWYTVLIRFFWGMLNGNIGVAKTYLAEICDDSNLPKAMSYFGIVGGVGRTIGPIIGGFLSLPADKYDVFKNTIFEQYPFALPSLIISISCIIIFVISYFTLIETKRFDIIIIDDDDDNDNNYDANSKNSGNSSIFSSISSRSSGPSMINSNRSSRSNVNNSNDKLLATKYSVLKTTEEEEEEGVDDDFEQNQQRCKKVMIDDRDNNDKQSRDNNSLNSSNDCSIDTNSGDDIELISLSGDRDIDIDYEVASNGYEEAKIPLNINSNKGDIIVNSTKTTLMDKKMIYSDDKNQKFNYNKRNISFLNIVKVKEIDTNYISYKKLKQVTTLDVPLSLSSTATTTVNNNTTFLTSFKDKTLLSNSNNNSSSSSIMIDIDQHNIDVLRYSNGAELSDSFYMKHQSYISNIIYLLKQPQIFISCTLYGMSSLVAIMISEIFPLWVVISPNYGGFSYDERTIGLSIMICGIASMITQVTLYSSLVQTYGILKVCRFSSILYAISVALMPLTSLTINLYSGNIAWILVIIMLFLQNIGTQWTLVCNFVLISNSCYSHQRATVNAIGQTCASLGRMVGPYIASIIFAWSLNNELTWPFNYHFIFYILSLLALINYKYSFLLPKSIQRRKREPKRNNEEIIELETDHHTLSPLIPLMTSSLPSSQSSYDVLHTNKGKNNSLSSKSSVANNNNSCSSEKSTSRSSSSSSSLKSVPPPSLSSHLKRESINSDVQDIESDMHIIDTKI